MTDDQRRGAPTTARVRPVLVTGATGRIGRAVVDRLLDAGVPVRAKAGQAIEMKGTSFFVISEGKISEVIDAS